MSGLETDSSLATFLLEVLVIGLVTYWQHFWVMKLSFL